MECFNVLNIEFTKDEKKIRRAYSKLLKEFSPEKDPEGFKKLRNAYEEALKKAKEGSIEEESPVSKFLLEFKRHYEEFKLRIDKDKWTELLERDVCIQIDTSMEIGKEVLGYLMDHFNLPLEIWQLLNEQFMWSSKKEELYKEFDNGFIDFVMYRINEPDNVLYEELKCVPDNKQDEFLKIYRQISGKLDRLDLYNGEKLIKESLEFCPNYPPLLLYVSWNYELRGDNNKAVEIVDKIIENNPEYLPVYGFKGDLMYRLGRLQEAYDNYKKSYAGNKKNKNVIADLAKICVFQGKYKEAIEFYKELGERAYNSEINMNLLNTAYRFYIESINDNYEDLSIEELIEIGKIYIKINEKEKAKVVIGRMMEIALDDVNTYILRLAILQEEENYELAYLTVNEALEKYNDNYKLHHIKGDILDELNNHEEAIKEYDKAIELNDNSAVLYNNKAYSLHSIKKYNESLESSNKALEIDSALSFAHMNKAKALLELGLIEDCFYSCNEALNINPYLVDAYITKMKALISIDKPEEATRIYDNAIEYGIEEGDLYNQQGEVLIYKEKYVEAIELINKAIEENGEKVNYLYNMGLCKYRQDNLEDAIYNFDLVLKKEPNNFKALYYKVFILSIKGSCYEEEAIQIIDKINEIDVENKDVFYAVKGDIFYNKGVYSEALKSYEEAIKLDDSKGNYFYRLAQCYYELKQKSEGIKYCKEALKLGKDDKEVYLYLVEMLATEGLYNECISYCKKAVEQYDDASELYIKLAQTCIEVRNLDEAEKACNKALELKGEFEEGLVTKLHILYLKEEREEAIKLSDRALMLYPNSEHISTFRKKKLKIKRNFFKR